MFQNFKQSQDSKKFYDTISHSVSSRYPNSENRSFASQEFIPNKLKVNTQSRSMSIHKFSTAKRATLRDFLSYHPKDKTPVKIQIHTSSVPIKIRTNKQDYEIPSGTTLQMTISRQDHHLSHDQYYINTIISISNVPCTIAFEFLYDETITPLSRLPGKPLKSDIPLPLDAITGHVSFIRCESDHWQIRKNIIFLDVKIAMDDKYQPHPTCVTILNHLGDPVFFQRIAPRKRIMEYFRQHSLVNDEILRGELDEEEALLQISRYWRGKIVVGYDLKDKIECLQMRIDEVLGIRDICGAKAIIKRFKSINRE